MKKKRNKTYQPSKKFNPAIIANRLEQNGRIIEKLKTTFEHKYQALENFLSLLVNFASHDIKNSVHNLDGIVSTIDIKNVTQSEIQSMKLSLDNIRETLEKFTEFNITRKYNSFELMSLFQSLEILHRPYLKMEGIEFRIFYDGIEKSKEINHDLQFLIYMFNNLMINSITALSGMPIKKIHIRISPIESDKMAVLFCDSGHGIADEIRNKIFEPYFTTKDKGTGVGLTHVKYVLDQVNGEIAYTGEKLEDLVTIFRIVLPLTNINNNDTPNSSN